MYTVYLWWFKPEQCPTYLLNYTVHLCWFRPKQCPTYVEKHFLNSNALLQYVFLYMNLIFKKGIIIFIHFSKCTLMFFIVFYMKIIKMLNFWGTKTSFIPTTTFNFNLLILMQVIIIARDFLNFLNLNFNIHCTNYKQFDCNFFIYNICIHLVVWNVL